MLKKLIQAFPSIKAKELSDEYIESHSDLMRDVPTIPLIRAVPLYMYWCVEHKQKEGSLVFENTISALNNYSRIKDSKLGYQDFKFSCDSKKIDTILFFLKWCESNLMLNNEPMLLRATKNWEKVNQSLISDAKKRTH